MKKILIILGLLPLYANGADLVDSSSVDIEIKAKYVFYSHGYIVEGKNPKPIHSRWGVYDFPAIKRSLMDSRYQLIAYHRPEGTEPFEFAEKLSEEVRTLIKRGVEPENITFVGFSRGGVISILVSDMLKNENLNYAILAACGPYINDNESIKLYGNVLSIRETSDDLVGSCDELAARSTKLISFQEISISTGEEHGAFYRPRPEWIDPLREWIERE